MFWAPPEKPGRAGVLFLASPRARAGPGARESPGPVGGPGGRAGRCIEYLLLLVRVDSQLKHLRSYISG